MNQLPAKKIISLIFPKVSFYSTFDIRSGASWLLRFSLLSGLSMTLLSAQADLVLDKAQSLLKTGRADAAGAVYKAYWKANPTSLPAELALAEMAMRQFDYNQARNILEKALAQHPDSPEVAAMLGRLFQLWSNSPAGKPTDHSRDFMASAQEHFRQALALGQNSPMALSYAADWQIQQNDLITAERNLQKAMRINPMFVPAFQGLTRFYMKARDMQRAQDAVQHAMELDPLDQATYFLTAQMLAIANRPAQAVHYAEKSEQLDFGRLPERDYFLATQYEKLGELTKAAQYYENLTVYTPKDPQIRMKLGDLYDALQQPEKSVGAYQAALRLKPDILDNLYVQVRTSTRQEKVESALAQWRKIRTLQPDKPSSVHEALAAIAGLHYLNYYNHSDQERTAQQKSAAQKDLALLSEQLRLEPDRLSLQLDQIKLQIALQGEVTDSLRQSLLRLTAGNDPAIAGEAAFLLEDFAKANTLLEQVDGLSDVEYGQLADRLLMDQELLFSQICYQRAYQLTPSADLEAALKRIQLKQNLATQQADAGNLDYAAKDYKAAIGKYQAAARLYPQWDNIYLKLGDTYERMHLWADSKKAYDKAISLSPGLIESKGFGKHYSQISKKAQKV